MARPDTWMPFYWGDFWMDTGHLTPAEGWAYINLIGAYWVSGAPLTTDEDRLQRLAKVTSLSEWERVRKTVLSFFTLTVTEDGHCYSHSRIDRELGKAKKAYKSRVDHMEKINASRKAKQSLSTVTDTVTEDSTQSLSTVTDTQPQPQPHSPYGDTRPSDDAQGASLKGKVWKPCLDFLVQASGKPENLLRGLVGKWVSDFGDERTLASIVEAQRNSPLEPIAYVEKVLRNAKRDAPAAPSSPEKIDPPPGLSGWRLAAWKHLGPVGFKSWVETAEETREDETVVLTYSTPFLRDYARNHHSGVFERMIKAADPTVKTLRITDALEIPGFLKRSA